MASMYPENPFTTRPAGRAVFGEAPLPWQQAQELDDESATYALVKNGPDVPAEQCERADASAVEITVTWGDNVLHVAHLSPPRPYAIGEAGDFPLPAARLGGSALPLIEVEAGQAYLVAPAAAKLTPKGKAASELSAQADPKMEIGASRRFPLTRGAAFELAFGDLIVSVSAVAAGKQSKRSFFGSSDKNALLSFGLTGVAAAAIIGATASFIPPLGLTDDEGASKDRIYAIQQYLESSAERERLEEHTNDEGAYEEGSSENSEAAKMESGKMGAVGKPITNKRAGVRGPKDNPDPHLAREQALREARSIGMIGLLNTMNGDTKAITVPWGRDTSLGTDPISAQGNMWGDELGESGGSGGLNLSGLGLGGGGRGEGIGVGMIGTCGSSICNGTSGGFGRSFGRNGPGHHTRAPKIGSGVTQVSNGRLPPEVIQRIVRQNFGRFRMCYETGLAKNPNLAGRVAVRFTIGRDGAVSYASNGGSDLPDSGVVSCVVSAYYGLSFPAPDDGIVNVTYPIQFSPG